MKDIHMRKNHVALILIVAGVIIAYSGVVAHPATEFFFLLFGITVDGGIRGLDLRVPVGFLLVCLGLMIIRNLAVSRIGNWFFSLKD